MIQRLVFLIGRNFQTNDFFKRRPTTMAFKSDYSGFVHGFGSIDLGGLSKFLPTEETAVYTRVEGIVESETK